MADVKVGLVTGNFAAEAKVIEKSLLKLQSGFKGVVTAVAQVNKAGTGIESLTIKAEGFTKAGQKISTVVKGNVKDLASFNAVIAKTTAALDAQTKVLFANDAAFTKRGKSIRRVAKSPKGITPDAGRESFGTQGEQLRIDQSVAKLAKLAEQAGLTTLKLNNMFRGAVAGDVKSYEGALVGVQKQILNVITEITNFGVAGQVAAEKARAAVLKETDAMLADVAATNRAVIAKQQLAAAFLAVRKNAATITPQQGSTRQQKTTPGEQVNVDESIAKLAKLAAQANLTEKELADMFSGVIAGKAKSYEGAVLSVQKQIIKLVGDINNMGVAGVAAYNKLTDAQLKSAAAATKVSIENARVAASQLAINKNAARGLRGRQGQRAATPIEKNTVAQAEEALRKLAKTTKVTGKQIDQIFAEVNSGQLKKYEGNLLKIQTATLRLQKAQAGLGASAAAAHAKAAAAAKKQAAELNKTKAATNSLVDSVKGLASVVGISLLIGGVFRLQQALEDGAEAAIEFSKRIAEIQTIQGTSGTTTEQWANQLKALSNAFGIPIIDQAEAAYQTLSNQVAKGTDSFLFLESANKLAVAAVTETSTAVNLLTSVINAFDLDVGRAEEIAAKLFKTVELGRVRIDEMAETLGRIAVPAAKLGIRFEELLGAIAVTTRQGIRFNEASTLMRGIILKLVKPTEAMKKLFEELGFASSEAAIRALTFPGLLKEIDKAAKGSSTELAKLFNRVRGTTGALIFAGDGLKDLNAEIGKIDASNLDTLKDATDLVAESLGKRFEIELTKVNNLFKDLGQEALEALLDINDAVGGLSKRLIEVAETVKSIGRLLGPLFKLVQLLNKFDNALGLGLSQAKEVVSVLLAFSDSASRIKDAAKALKGFNREIESGAVELTDQIQKEELQLTQEILRGFKERNNAFFLGIAKQNKALFASNKKRLAANKDLIRGGNAVTAALVKNIKDTGSRIDAQLKKLKKEAADTAKDIAKSFQTAGKNLFDFDIGIAVDKTQIALIDNQLAQARAARDAAVASGDKDTFNRRSAQINSLLKQRFAVVSKVSKAQRTADKKVSDAKVTLIRAEASGDKEKTKNARNALKDAKSAQRQVGDISAEELDIQQKIVAVRRKLKDTRSEADTKAFREELRGLQQLQASIASESGQENQQRDSITDAFAVEKKLRLDLQKLLQSNALVAQKKLSSIQILTAEVIDLDKQRRAFDLVEVLKGEDPAEITKEVSKQEAAIQRTIALQEKLDIGKDRQALEKELANIQLATADKLQLIQLKADEASRRATEAGLKVREKALRAEGKITASNLALAAKGVALAAREVEGTSLTEFQAQTGKEGADAVQSRERLIRSLGLLGKILAKEAKFPGSFTPEDVSASIKNAFEAILTINRKSDVDLDRGANAVRGRGFGSKGFGDVFGTLKDFAGGSGKREEELEATNDLLGNLLNSFTGGDIPKLVQQAQENRQRLLEVGREGTADLGVKFAAVAAAAAVPDRASAEKSIASITKDNHVDAAKAMHDDVVKNAADGAVAAEEAVAKLREQKLKQAELAKAGGGLTGFAARIKASDEGRGTSAFDIRKREAEARRDQRKRNEDFLRRRREQKAIENKTATGATGGGLGDTAQLATQLKAQLAVQKKRALDGDPQAITNTGVLQKQLDILSNLEQRDKTPDLAKKDSEKAPSLFNREVTNDFIATTVSNTSAINILTGALEELARIDKEQLAPIKPKEEVTTLKTSLDGFLTVAKEIRDALRTPTQKIDSVLPQLLGNQTQDTGLLQEFGRINPQILPQQPRMPDFNFDDPLGTSLPPITIENNLQLNIDGKPLATTLQPHLNRLDARSNRQNTNPSNRRR